LSDLENRLKALREQATRFEKERIALETMASEARKSAAELVPKLNAEIADVDAEIKDLQTKRAGLVEQLKLLGIKVQARAAGATGVIGARGTGLSEKMKELMTSVGVGGKITNADIQEALGSASGYVGMIISAEVKEGRLKREAPGQYTVMGLS